MAARADTPTQPSSAKPSDIISSFRPCRKFRADDPKANITSLDFDDSGELALISRDDDTLQIYNCKEGKHAKELKSQKYGVQLARFTHHSQSIIYASTKVDDTIRYLSTHDNSYIRYFRGHTSAVTCLTVSPAQDNFLSCSTDDTVKLWALNSPNTQGQLKLSSPYLAAYDPSATVIAIASAGTQSVLLYDLRQFDKSPFATFDLSAHVSRFAGSTGKANGSYAGYGDWTRLEFSNDGRVILLGTAGAGHLVLDAFDGALKHFLYRRGAHSGRRPPGHTAAMTGGTPVSGSGDLCLSPDGRYVLGGSGSDGLLVWDTHAATSHDQMLRPCSELPGPGRAALVGYNQRLNQLCSADRDFFMWLPDPDSVP